MSRSLTERARCISWAWFSASPVRKWEFYREIVRVFFGVKTFLTPWEQGIHWQLSLPMSKLPPSCHFQGQLNNSLRTITVRKVNNAHFFFYTHISMIFGKYFCECIFGKIVNNLSWNALFSSVCSLSLWMIIGKKHEIISNHVDSRMLLLLAMSGVREQFEELLPKRKHVERVASPPTF